MFLRRLRLKNLRSIAELDMQFVRPNGDVRPWTFVLGENGAGKSTILRALALVTAGGEALSEIIGDPDTWIRVGSDAATIELDYATAENQPRHAQLILRRGEGIRKLLETNANTLEQIDAALAHSTRNYFVVGYGVSRRRSAEPISWSGMAGGYRNNRAQSVATLFSPDATLVSIEQWALDLDYRRGAQGLRPVRKALDTLLADAKFDSIDKERRQLLFQTPDGVLPLSQLSDGYQAMTAWCGDVLFRITETFADRTDPLSARGVLLIDELDLHLHPIWQRQLVSFIKRTLPNFQVVATTHSPLTVHQAEEGELFVLRRPDRGNAASSLTKFEGAPNKLMLHQLIQSPIFGLETLDSPQVASLRRELRSLKGVADEAPADGGRTVASETAASPRPASQAARSKRVKQIETELASVPTWSEVPEYLQSTNNLLRQISEELSTSSGSARGSKRSTKSRSDVGNGGES
ncbi:AAA family ATPase [Agrobacterium deltaense]